MNIRNGQGIHNFASQRCILDGEVVVMKSVKLDFYEVQRRTLMTDKFKISMAAQRLTAVYVAYDCLFWKNQSLLDYSLMKRKEILNKNIVKEADCFK